MIVILHEKSSEVLAEQIAENLLNAFHDNIEVCLISAEAKTEWPGSVAWDDLLILLYGGSSYPESGNEFIHHFIAARHTSARMLPVSTDIGSRRPPKDAAGIKALPYDVADSDSRSHLVRRAGAMLGLRLQGRDSKIFVSYRAVDGTAIAKQLHSHLTSLGYPAFLDEARELDGDTRILPGTPVQSQIDEALSDANLVLLIDTPAAPQSPWVRHEVETADALLLPILPLCFRESGDKKQGPRFRSLLALQRWVQFLLPDEGSDPLEAAALDHVVNEVEMYLCEIYRRKCRVPFIVEQEFVSHGYDWKPLDKKLLLFESSKTHNLRLQMKVRSHCSLFDQIYSPAIKRFGEYLDQSGRGNFSLFIYDGELLAGPQIEDVVREHSNDVIILHHQELAALIDSGFTKLGTP